MSASQQKRNRELHATIESLETQLAGVRAEVAAYRADLESHKAASVGELYTRLRDGQKQMCEMAERAEAEAAEANADAAAMREMVTRMMATIRVATNGFVYPMGAEVAKRVVHELEGEYDSSKKARAEELVRLAEAERKDYLERIAAMAEQRSRIEALENALVSMGAEKQADGSWRYPGPVEMRIEELEAALQDLADLQNGPPLIREEKQWNAAMERARALLSAPATPLADDYSTDALLSAPAQSSERRCWRCKDNANPDCREDLKAGGNGCQFFDADPEAHMDGNVDDAPAKASEGEGK